MTELANEKELLKSAWLGALKTFGKIMLAFVFAFCYAVGLLFLMVPETDAKLFNFLGLKKAEESCYVRIYQQSDDLVDLYNLIIFESKQGETAKELQYVNMMLASDDYDEFVVSFNNSSIANLMNEKGEIEDKKLVPLVCNINSYFLNQKVGAMVELGFEKESIAKFVCTNLEDANLFEYSIAVYLNAITGDKSLSVTKKQEVVTTLLETKNNTKTVAELLAERINNLNLLIGTQISEVTEILAMHTLVNLRLAEYRISEIKGEDLTTVKTNYEAALNSYNECVK